MLTQQTRQSKGVYAYNRKLETNLASVRKSAKLDLANTFAVIEAVLWRIEPEEASASKPAESKTLNRKSPNLATPSRMSRVT